MVYDSEVFTAIILKLSFSGMLNVYFFYIFMCRCQASTNGNIEGLVFAAMICRLFRSVKVL
jgi:hypothetical protein